MIWDEITFIAEFWLELGDLLSAKLLFLKSPISILPKLSLIQSFKVEILCCLYLCWISKFRMPPIWKGILKRKDQSIRKLQQNFSRPTTMLLLLWIFYTHMDFTCMLQSQRFCASLQIPHWRTHCLLNCKHTILENQI